VILWLRVCAIVNQSITIILIQCWLGISLPDTAMGGAIAGLAVAASRRPRRLLGCSAAPSNADVIGQLGIPAFLLSFSPPAAPDTATVSPFFRDTVRSLPAVDKR